MPFPVGRGGLAAEARSVCANCGAPLTGPYCHACGQLAESFERSVWSLLREALAGFFDADGRIFNTLPRLIFRPASLTRSYLAGKRASQTPPLRLFLVIIVLVFFAGGLRSGHVKYDLYEGGAPTEAALRRAETGLPAMQPFVDWLNPRVVYAASHQQEFGEAIASWLHDIAVMFLPVATALLSAIFIFRRKFFVFEHAIFSMHSLSFMGALATIITLMSSVAPLRGLAPLLVLAAPTHLFLHMRGLYGTSVIGTLLRMGVLFVLSAFGAVALLLCAVALGLGGLSPSAS